MQQTVTRNQVIREIEELPPNYLTEILDFVRLLKKKNDAGFLKPEKVYTFSIEDMDAFAGGLLTPEQFVAKAKENA